MQSHRVLWNVSLSNGENFREGQEPFLEVEGQLSPWNQLLAYLEHHGETITAMWLSTATTRFHLPSKGITHNPKLTCFHAAEKPTGFKCFRRMASDATDQDNPENKKELFTVAEAQYASHKIQLFVSEYDPGNSWVFVEI